MDLRKKAIMETQFAWIFVLIVGGVILLFFVGVSQSQRESAEVKSSGIFSKEFDAILSGFGVSVGTSHKIFLPQIDILVDCNTFTVGYTSNNLENKILFSPDQIKGDALVAWTLSWNLPFKITNFILLTGSNLRYIVVNDSTGNAENLFDSLPNEMLKELVDENAVLLDKHNYKVRFIFIDETDVISSTLPSGLSNKEKDISAVKLIDGGEVEFYNFNNGLFELEGESYFIGENAKFAPIFTENIEFYECVMEKAFKRLEFISLMHYERAEVLETLTFDLCEAPGFYNPGKLLDMNQHSNWTINDINELKDLEAAIIFNNNKLMQNACPPIY